ncbi:hypothetical protein MJL30_37860, partial [Salmonella enterica subsp. enterica serovar Anatum]|nr:hypothetical protein [Salmonella enterica subsp. enterica serovar Anatum]
MKEFFTDNGTEWVHKRIEDDLAAVRETLAKRSAAGKITRPAANAVKQVADRLRPFGLTLKIYDCYRPQSAVNDFIAWA